MLPGCSLEPYLVASLEERITEFYNAVEGYPEEERPGKPADPEISTPLKLNEVAPGWQFSQLEG
jgi:hypothetical protein